MLVERAVFILQYQNKCVLLNYTAQFKGSLSTFFIPVEELLSAMLISLEVLNNEFKIHLKI